MVGYDQSLILMCESFNMSTKIQFIFSNPKKGGKKNVLIIITICQS